MPSLEKTLRNQLERAVKEARDIAEAGAKAALETLGVGDAGPPSYLDDDQRNLRRRLRIHGRQLGDLPDEKKKTQEIERLTEEVAYEHWHRMLFARFLAENNLLMYPDPHSPVAVSLAECEDLAADEGARNGWELAARFAARMLPQIFRIESPIFELELPPESQQQLEKLISDLSVEVFTASDSLGWVYQFWQANRKKQINESEVKIGSRELPAVTQLFTEDYMVDFLLDNTLGAWWAGKQQGDGFQCSKFSEELNVRNAVALSGCPWNYLRFIQSNPLQPLGASPPLSESDESAPNAEEPNANTLRLMWRPAAGTFDGWPNAAKDLKCLDPCMGSGHFVVAMFERLVALRMTEEQLNETDAVYAVIRDNLFGLEIDPRCTQIAAFNLALAAWRRIGYCILPPMNLACSGLAPNTSKAEWLALAGDNEKLQNGMEQLFELFEKAPVLGSLINPQVDQGNLLVATFDELRPLLEMAVAQEKYDETTQEIAVIARGLAKAADVLSAQYTLVATNVPYLGRGKQNDTLKCHLEQRFPNSKADLATAFIERCGEFCAKDGTTVLVTPQNWLFLTSYTKLRESLLRYQTWNATVRLGANAFQDMNWWAATTALVAFSQSVPTPSARMLGMDVSMDKQQSAKAHMLLGETPIELYSIPQSDQLANPDARITIGLDVRRSLLATYVTTVEGLCTGDSPQFVTKFWELPQKTSVWEYFIQKVDESTLFGGRSDILKWEGGCGSLRANPSAHNFPAQLMNGRQILGKPGLRVAQMGGLSCTLYGGEMFGNSGGTLVPHDSEHLPAIWTFCSSKEYSAGVRQIDQKLNVTISTLAKVEFDLAHWQQLSVEKYPDGLPEPETDDSTQWLFHGWPVTSTAPLQVAVARLLGYKWPAEFDGKMRLSQRAKVFIHRTEELNSFADTDGIVCIPPVRGEAGAADRLLNLLATAYGNDWSSDELSRLLGDADYAGKSLETWLRDGFFQQHCELFQQRPFIWHIWDGLRDGFSALVNYHKLDRKLLDNLTHNYLGDWITRCQLADKESGLTEDGEKTTAAKNLKRKQELILAGESPYDIFVRWKPLHQQPIGWEPDINDGVRMNIRPFVSVPDVKAKGAGILRVKPKIKWEKDRGKEPERSKEDFPWFWGWDGKTTDFPGGPEFKGDRFNDCHYTLARKHKAKDAVGKAQET